MQITVYQSLEWKSVYKLQKTHLKIVERFVPSIDRAGLSSLVHHFFHHQIAWECSMIRLPWYRNVHNIFIMRHTEKYLKQNLWYLPLLIVIFATLRTLIEDNMNKIRFSLLLATFICTLLSTAAKPTLPQKEEGQTTFAPWTNGNPYGIP